jgi:hypothetical protein
MEKAHCKAAKYIFNGFWVAEAKKATSSPCRPITGSLEALVENLCDGSWNENLFKMTNYFSTKKSYMDFVNTLPDVEKKTRLSQADNAWECHIKIDQKKQTTYLKEA